MNLEIINGGTIKDNKSNKLKKLLRKFLKSDINLFVTSGAISAGKYDFIPKLVKNCGFKKCFKGVAIKPGRPIMLSKLNDKLFFGLPGNPISCAAGFRFFIYPLIRSSLGMLKEKKFKAQLINKYSKSRTFFRKGGSRREPHKKAKLNQKETKWSQHSFKRDVT